MEVGPGIATPLNVQKLQTASHAKAKENPSFRFYALYDKLYRTDVLQYVYACCKANQSAAGVDEERFELHETPLRSRAHDGDAALSVNQLSSATRRMTLDVAPAEIGSFVEKRLGMRACKRIREAIAKAETGRVAPLAEFAKSLPGNMGLFHIDGDEFELGFGDEQIEIAYAVGSVARLDDHRALDERRC